MILTTYMSRAHIVSLPHLPFRRDLLHCDVIHPISLAMWAIGRYFKIPHRYIYTGFDSDRPREKYVYIFLSFFFNTTYSGLNVL